jgi:hypothetical protein
MSAGNGREELARRLGRIFVSVAKDPDGTEYPEGTRPVEDTVLLRFADEILAADYYDPSYGPRPGDGGPAARLELDE